jgi:hypothetical protein
VGNTLDIVVGNTHDIEFIANVSGDWALHCHKTHHTTSGMQHGKASSHQMHMPMGTPGPFGNIDMSGMFTIVKVRDEISDYQNLGWYKNPPGTVASPVQKQSN